MSKTIAEFIAKQKDYYRSIDSVYSPALKAKVYFRSDGFRHLIYTSNRQLRKVSEQWLKLTYLNFAVQTIRQSQKYSEERIIRKRVNHKVSIIRMYSLVMVEEDLKVRVIVIKIANGKYYFHSVMPHSKARVNINKKRH